MAKVFFFDLDGTLLTDEKTVSAGTYAALEEFAKRGNHFAVNTGRGMESTYNTCRDLGLLFPGSFLCCYNGSRIYDVTTGEDVYRTGVPKDLIPVILSVAGKHGIHIHTYERNMIITPDEGKELDFYRRVIKTPYILSKDIVSDLITGEDPCKIIAIELEDRGKIERFRDEAMALCGDRLTMLFSSEYYLEIFDSKAGKGSAVRNLCAHLGIPVSDSYAAGDEENDISMIEEAGLGIAMKNSKDTVKAAADEVTEEDNNHDGLLPFIIKAYQTS